MEGFIVFTRSRVLMACTFEMFLADVRNFCGAEFVCAKLYIFIAATSHKSVVFLAGAARFHTPMLMWGIECNGETYQ